MYSSFIPSFHFTEPSKKLYADWCWDAIQSCYHQTKNYNLLEGKNVEEIDGYASGNFSMKEFRRMYKSEIRKMEAEANNRFDTRSISSSEIGFVPLPLIPTKLNSAISIVSKVPIEITVSAVDALAVKKKNEDLVFLKNKSALEADLQPFADQMQIGKVDLGTTKHSAIPFSDSPYGLNLQEPDELEVFEGLLYNLAVEAGLENALQGFQEIKNGIMVKLMEIKDQFKFGVSCHTVFQSAMTSLPDIKYLHPSSIEAPYSDLPDYSDNTHRFYPDRVTVMELFNLFGDEICDENTLFNIINAPVTGYCDCNKLHKQDVKNFNSFKLDLLKCEIKSIDYVGVAPLNKKSKFNYVVTDKEEAKKCKNKVWGQNTYVFWWLKNTKYFFGIHRLSFAHRTVGRESYQNFPSNIYKSQQKSAVELSVGENKKAQIADIKMQAEIIAALPHGKYINLKFLRSALAGLTEEGTEYTQQSLIDLAMERNWFIGDTEGFDGKNDGQLKPFEDIPGGVKGEVIGYMQVIADASNKISQFTGINEQLTGQSANPEGLIGLQKLLINSSINALYYVNEAISNQEQKKFTIWATIIKAAIEKGGKAKQAIVDLVGAKKVSLIDALDEVPLHTMGVKVSISQREEEKNKFENELMRLKMNGVINTVDEYMLSSVVNPKDRMALLAVKYKQWEKKQDKIRQEQMANQQAMIEQQGANMQRATETKVEGEVKKIYAQGDVNSKILELANHFGMSAAQLDGLIKKELQQDRGDDQLNKSIKTLMTKSELENQKPFGT